MPILAGNKPVAPEPSPEPNRAEPNRADKAVEKAPSIPTIDNQLSITTTPPLCTQDETAMPRSQTISWPIGPWRSQRPSKRVSLLLGQPKNNNSAFAKLEEHPVFRNTTLVIIVINALWIAIDVEWNHSTLREAGQLPLEPVSTVVEFLFCMYFTGELVIRFLAFNKKLRCIWDKWFVFDATLVLFMVLETWVLPVVGAIAGGEASGGPLSNLSSFRLLRLLRLTRMAKIMRFFPELLTLIRSIVSATQAVFFILLFLVIVMYVFAIVFTSQLNGGQDDAAAALEPEVESEDPTAKEMFSDLGSSMMSLFTHGVLGDNLIQAIVAIKDESLLLMWVFILFMLISGITLLNMLIGVLCQVVDDSSKEEEEVRQLADLRSTLTEAFKAADESKDGRISAAEWGNIKTNHLLRASLAKLGVEESDIPDRVEKMRQTLFEQADEDSAPTYLGFEEFADKIMDMRWDTPAKILDVEMLKAAVTQEDASLKRRMEAIEAKLHRLLVPEPECLCPRQDADVPTKPLVTQSSGWLADVPTELLMQALKTRE